MPSRIPQLKPREVLRTLEKLGFIVRRTTGSHWILRHPETKRMTSVPFHPRDIKRGLLFGILRQTGISQEEFLKALGD